MTDKATWLYWTFEYGPEESELDEDPDDVGTAWIERPDGTETKLNAGELITRAEARRLASAAGYELRERG
jgi:hypothetical protein